MSTDRILSLSLRRRFGDASVARRCRVRVASMARQRRKVARRRLKVARRRRVAGVIAAEPRQVLNIHNIRRGGR